MIEKQLNANKKGGSLINSIDLLILTFNGVRLELLNISMAQIGIEIALEK